MSENDDPIKNSFGFLIHSTGEKSEIPIISRVISCGKCIEIETCNNKNTDNKCVKIINVKTEKLLLEDESSMNINPKALTCENDEENDTGVGITGNDQINSLLWTTRLICL